VELQNPFANHLNSRAPGSQKQIASKSNNRSKKLLDAERRLREDSENNEKEMH
jgi:hypothetical protein